MIARGEPLKMCRDRDAVTDCNHTAGRQVLIEHILTRTTVRQMRPNFIDDIVIRAMAKWPNVPVVYGWLALDRRGQWSIKGAAPAGAAAQFEPVTNPKL